MGFSQEVIFILSGANVGVPKFNMFRSSAKVVPTGPGPYLSVIETGGTGSENTHNSVIRPAYQSPGAQIVVRGDSYDANYDMARAAYDALVKVRNEYIGSGILSPTGTWYRKIRPLQEPGDVLGLDAQSRQRISFNILADKRPS